MGGQQMALTALQVGLEALQKALPGLPMGTDLHTKVLKAVQDLSKAVAEAGAAQDQSAKMQQLVAMARSAQQQPNQQAMMRAFPANQNASPPPAAAGGGMAA
jgi:enamine deaminase RidA (YjgF/YER057c/UK114 family)